MDVHNAKLLVNILCLHYRIKHPTRLRTQPRASGQYANTLFRHTSYPLTPY